MTSSIIKIKKQIVMNIPMKLRPLHALKFNLLSMDLVVIDSPICRSSDCRPNIFALIDNFIGASTLVIHFLVCVFSPVFNDCMESICKVTNNAAINFINRGIGCFLRVSGFHVGSATGQQNDKTQPEIVHDSTYNAFVRNHQDPYLTVKGCK